MCHRKQSLLELLQKIESTTYGKFNEHINDAECII